MQIYLEYLEITMQERELNFNFLAIEILNKSKPYFSHK